MILRQKVWILEGHFKYLYDFTKITGALEVDPVILSQDLSINPI